VQQPQPPHRAQGPAVHVAHRLHQLRQRSRDSGSLRLACRRV